MTELHASALTPTDFSPTALSSTAIRLIVVQLHSQRSIFYRLAHFSSLSSAPRALTLSHALLLSLAPLRSPTLLLSLWVSLPHPWSLTRALALPRAPPRLRCNSSQGILPQIQEILGHEYVHVRSLGVDELFVRKQPCAASSVPLQPPPYSRYPPHGLPAGPQSRGMSTGHLSTPGRTPTGHPSHRVLPSSGAPRYNPYNRTQAGVLRRPTGGFGAVPNPHAGPTHGNHNSMVSWTKDRFGRLLAESWPTGLVA